MVIDNPVVAYNEDAMLKCVSNHQYFQEDTFPFTIEADVGSGSNVTEDRIYERY